MIELVKQYKIRVQVKKKLENNFQIIVTICKKN